MQGFKVSHVLVYCGIVDVEGYTELHHIGLVKSVVCFVADLYHLLDVVGDLPYHLINSHLLEEIIKACVSFLDTIQSLVSAIIPQENIVVQPFSVLNEKIML